MLPRNSVMPLDLCVVFAPVIYAVAFEASDSQ